MSITIKVLQKHIDAGKRGKCSSCPIALAVKEQCGVAQCSVHSSFVCFGGKYWQLPLSAQEFITFFDSESGKYPKPEPFSFVLSREWDPSP